MKRPLSVTFVACVYLLVGTAGFVAHFKESVADPADGVWIMLTELVAIVCGIFLLRRANWARWLALAWMLFHVALSYPVVRQLVMHGVICALIAWFLFNPGANRYFRGAPIEPT